MTPKQNSYKKSSFGPAFFFLSAKRRRALADYYEFCRLMDDIVDEPCKNPAEELNNWTAEIERVYQQTPQTELGKRLQQNVLCFSVPKDRFLLLIAGMRDDLEGKKYSSYEQLNTYLHRVAVVVGQATLDILGVQGEQADQLAWALGSAVQLTNIVRDVKEDARLGRVYLPCTLSPKEVLNDTKKKELCALLHQAAQKAYENYTQAFILMTKMPRLKMLPCRIMGYVYLKNLAKIEKEGFCSQRPIKLTKFEKLMMVFYAISKTFV